MSIIFDLAFAAAEFIFRPVVDSPALDADSIRDATGAVALRLSCFGLRLSELPPNRPACSASERSES